MKICILSMQRILNFGSVLQAYALKSILEKLGHTVAFIDIEKRPEDDALFPNQEKPEIVDCKVKTRKIDKYLINKVQNKIRLKTQGGLYQSFCDDTLHLSSENSEIEYDYCVIGSDEVFNCATPSEWGFTSQLFGNVRQVKQVITYAASCGATRTEMLPKKVKSVIQKQLNTVKAISVRDANTEKFVSGITGKSVARNYDPVVVFNFDDEISRATLPRNLPKRYCIIYSYYNRIGDNAEIQAILKFCREKKLEPIAVGGAQFWIPRYIPMEPFQVLKVFQNAEFVITDTFHGTIFSTKYAKRFATMVRKSNANKLNDLICSLHIEAHQVDTMEDLEQAYGKIHDKSVIRQIEKDGMQNTTSYLKDALEEQISC